MKIRRCGCIVNQLFGHSLQKDHPLCHLTSTLGTPTLTSNTGETCTTLHYLSIKKSDRILKRLPDISFFNFKRDSLMRPFDNVSLRMFLMPHLNWTLQL